jgi:hypothetical protein
MYVRVGVRACMCVRVRACGCGWGAVCVYVCAGQSQHFEEEHYPCKHPDCENLFLAFTTELALRAHEVRVPIGPCIYVLTAKVENRREGGTHTGHCMYVCMCV